MTIGNKGAFNQPGPGYYVINKYGVNLDIDTASDPETIWAHGGPFPFLDVGIPMDIISSSADDTLLGTGAQKIIITYYNTDSTENVVEYDMAGAGRVQIDDDLKIGTRIRVSQTGTGMTNAGKISLVDRATGLVVYQSIEIGEGKTLSAVQICPKGKKGLVKKHSVTFAKFQSPAGAADMRFNKRYANGSINVEHPTVISTVKTEDITNYEIGGIEMAAGDIVYWNCETVTADNTPIEARFDVEFQDV